MLKIKDNIDLKELEKFGFRHHKRDDNITMISKWSRDWVEEDRSDGYTPDGGFVFYPIIRITFQRLILMETYHQSVNLMVETLFDLIQAGLIEKVGGKSE